MKKLMITLSAAAMAFGLFADGVTFPVGENFNASTDIPATITGATGTDTAVSDTAYTFSQENVAGLPDMFGEALAGNNLNIKTAFNAPIAYAPFGDDGQVLDATHLYFDSLVKFTACDEAPDMSSYTDAKLVVWVKEEEDGNTVTKKLMVTAGLLNSELVPTAQNYDCGDPADYDIESDTDWCRLTIKAVKDITPSSGVSGFVIFVNGKAVTIRPPKNIGIAESALTGPMSVWRKNDHLFPSLIEQDATIHEVAFAGQGAIDDISFTKTEPKNASNVQFALDQDPPIATVNGTDCVDLAGINAAIAAASSGAAVVLVANVEGDIVFNNDAANTLNLGAFTLDGGISVGSATTLTIDGTGAVMGTLYSDNLDAMVLLNGGKYLKSENADIKDMAEAKAGFEIAEVGDYWEVVEISEDGTTAKPWKIGSAADLQNKLLAKCEAGTDAEHMNFIMTDNIDLTGTLWDGPGESRTAEGAFIGVFDGQGYTISNLTLAKKEYNGFFGCLAGTAQVKNLTILVAGFGGDAPSDGSYGAGGAVGFSMGTDVLVENVTVKGQGSDTVLSGTHNVGGVCCRLEGKITVKNCTNELNIASTYTKIAGICPIAAIRDAAGAIVFDGCVNKGNVTGIGTNNAGRDGCSGILGYIEGDKPLTIKNCESYGTFTSESTNAKKASIFSDPYKYVATEISGNKATANVAAYGNRDGKTVDGLNYAVVDGDVATFVANSAVVAGGSYKVMSPTVKAFSITLAKDETIAFDKTLSSEFVATVTPAEGCKVTTSTTGTVTTYTCAELKKATVPTAATGLTYTGETLTGVAAGEGYTLTGNTATDAGDYTATATLAEGYDQWSDGGTEAKSIAWSIAKATPTITTAPTASAEIEKGAALSTISLVGGAASVAGTFAWTAPETTVAEDGAFGVTFTPTDTKNYDTATCTVAVTVKKGEELPTYIDPTDTTMVGKYKTWADKYGADTKSANMEAFLLDCAPDSVAEAKAAFKVTSLTQDENGDWIATVGEAGEGEAYKNGFIHVVPYTLEGAGDNAAFYQATLLLKPVTE